MRPLRFCDAEWRSDWEATVAEFGDEASVTKMPRTNAQRRFDAFWRIFERAAATPPDATPAEPLVNVVVDIWTLDELINGQALNQHTRHPDTHAAAGSGAPTVEPARPTATIANSTRDVSGGELAKGPSASVRDDARVTSHVLTDRALNRATLERQLLLRRTTTTPEDAIERLVGLQAQNPLDPYLALWSRLEGFDAEHVGRLVEARRLVRIVVMRGTIHLVTADDALFLRPLVQPVLDAEIARHGEYAVHLAGVDVEPVLHFVRMALAERPMTGRLLREAIGRRFPDLHAAALAYAARCHLALVQVPPRGVWRRTAQVCSTTVEAWLGRDLETAPSIDRAVLRYLAAFGPATVADVSAWSRLTEMREVVDRLLPQLVTVSDARGRQLYDLPDAPRPDPDVPAPVRFLPEYDNVLLSHADRNRFATEDERRFAGSYGGFKGSVLVDGHLRAVWRFQREKRSDRVAVVIEHLPLDAASRDAVELEARAAATFWHAGAPNVDVRLVAAA